MPQTFSLDDAVGSTPPTFGLEEAMPPASGQAPPQSFGLDQAVAPAPIRSIPAPPGFASWDAYDAASKAYSESQNSSDFLTALATSEAAGIDPAHPFSVPLAPLTAAGNYARAAMSDLGATISGHPGYGGNLVALANNEPLPVDQTLAAISAQHPIAATAGKIAEGTIQAAPMMATAFPEGAIGRIAALGFTGSMIPQAKRAAQELGTELGKPVEQRNEDKITSSLADLAQTAVFAPLAGAHGLGDVTERIITPKTFAIRQLARQLSEEPTLMPHPAEPIVEPGSPTAAPEMFTLQDAIARGSEAAGEPQTPPPSSQLPIENARPGPIVEQTLQGIAPETTKIESEAPNATQTRIVASDNIREHPGVSPRPDLPTDAEQVRTQGGESPGDSSGGVNGPQEPQTQQIATSSRGLVPVQVSDAQIRAFRAPIERAPDILDTIQDHFPGGVKFASKPDFGEYLNNARGYAAQLMSHTEGEPADKVLDGLHLAGEFLGIQSEDELAKAMVEASNERIAHRTAASSEARALAEEQARTDLFTKANRSKGQKTQPVPAAQLIPGDKFKLNGHTMEVVSHGFDPETGKPFAVDLEGAYGRQTVGVNSTVHVDKGSYQEAPAAGRIAASGTSAPKQYKVGDKVLHNGEVKTVTRAVPGVDYVGLGKRAVHVREIQPFPANPAEQGRIAASGTGAPRQSTAIAAPALRVPGPVAAAPVPASSPIGRWFQERSIGLKRIFAPASIDAGAKQVADILREYNGEKANNLARAEQALHTWRAEFDRTPVPRNWAYNPTQPLPHNFAVIDALERNRGSLPARYQALAAQFDKEFEWRIAAIRQFAPNALQHLIENYFPHIWEDPKRAAGVMQQLATRLFAGRKEFLKQRTLPFFKDGLARGLKPISDNPVDLLLAKLHSMDKFLAALKAQAEFKAIGKMKFKYALEPMPEGWAKIDDPAFIVHAPPTVTLKEAFDAQLRARTLELLQKLGVSQKRLASLGGKRWGLAYEKPEQIKTRFGGPMSVYWHELGHVLDYRYDLQKSFLKQGKLFDAELRALADRRLPTKGARPSMRKYVRSGAEKMAVMTEAYVHAPDVFKRVAPTVYTQFDRFIENHSELQDLRELKPSLRLDTGTMEQKLPGILKLGDWIMPEGPAQVLQNYLSPGLARFGLYRSIRAASNLLNAAQLGLSGFHVGFTSLDAVVNAAEVGLFRALHGDFAGGAKTLAKAPLAPVANYYVGKAVQAAMLGKQTVKVMGIEAPVSAAARNYAELAVKGGLRATVDPFWQTHLTRNLMRSVREGGLAWAKTPLQAPLAMVEQSMRPIVEYLVPRQKLGVFALLAKSEMDRLPANAPPEMVRAAMARAADATEDRMGQMTYDNLFYNRAAKDLALLSFRAYGWQLGKYRHLAGAATDTVANLRQLATGRVPQLTHRQLYFIAMPAIVAGIGGVLHYMLSGHRPRDLRDYLHPSTGQKDQLGNDKRLSLPSYLKDLESDAYAVEHGYQTGGPLGVGEGLWTATYHRLNPWVGQLVDMLNDRDFYGTQIWNPEDPLSQKMLDQAKYLASGAVPFSVAGSMKLMQGEHSPRDLILPFVGVVPAKQAISMTPAQLKAAEYIHSQASIAGRTQSQAEHGRIVAQVVSGLRTTNQTVSADLLDHLRKTDLPTIKDRLKYTPLQYQVSKMPLNVGMSVFDLGSPQERAQLAPILQQKLITAYKSGSSTVEEISRWAKLISDAQMTNAPAIGR